MQFAMQMSQMAMGMQNVQPEDEIKAWAEAEHAKIPKVSGGPGVGMVSEPRAS